MAHRTILTPPSECLYYQDRKVSGHVCVRGVDFDSISTIFLLDFGNVPTVWDFKFTFHNMKNIAIPFSG